jgi:hypothetical protein
MFIIFFLYTQTHTYKPHFIPKQKKAWTWVLNFLTKKNMVKRFQINIFRGKPKGFSKIETHTHEIWTFEPKKNHCKWNTPTKSWSNIPSCLRFLIQHSSGLNLFGLTFLVQDMNWFLVWNTHWFTVRSTKKDFLVLVHAHTHTRF